MLENGQFGARVKHTKSYQVEEVVAVAPYIIIAATLPSFQRRENANLPSPSRHCLDEQYANQFARHPASSHVGGEDSEPSRALLPVPLLYMGWFIEPF
jgi:hypothetical protein